MLQTAQQETAEPTSRTEPAGIRPHLVPAGLLMALALALAVWVFVMLTSDDKPTDIMGHAKFARAFAEDGVWFNYSVWYPLVYFAGGANGDLDGMRVASVVLLSIAYVARIGLTYVAVWWATRSRAWAFGLSAALGVVMAVYDPARPDRMYVGTISPNIFHNSTNIAAAPLVILAFLLAVRMLRQLTVRSAVWFGTAAAVCALVKPNYLVAMVPVVAVALLGCLIARRRREPLAALGVLAGALLPVAATLVAQYVAVFAAEDSTRESELVVYPLTVWSYWSERPVPVMLLLSAAFPIAVLLARGRAVLSDPPLLLAWGVYAVAIAQVGLLAEQWPDGRIDLAGNWFWAGHSAALVLFLVSAISATRIRNLWLRAGVFAVLGLHVVSGLIYLQHLAENGNWW